MTFPSNNKYLNIKTIFLWAIIFRIILLAAYPVLENDYLRYLWDEYLIARFGSAYGLLPSSLYSDQQIPITMLTILTILTILNLLSYPEFATVYGPLSEFIFYIANLIVPGEIWSIKIFVIFFRHSYFVFI